MNKLSFLLLLAISLFYVNTTFAQDEVIINYNAPEITFDNEIIDLGTFMQYDDPSSKCEFLFTNTGKEPLIISKAKGSCGCTVPNWPKEPIMPGETGTIKVNYDEKRVGSFNKSITITSNARNSVKVLKIKGKILTNENKTTEPLKQNSNLAPTAN
tara:strand:+ start:81 stop:548 length:468 start_codon:yes stop_codon:yes gene_type:complete